jgi:hypothetical protein
LETPPQLYELNSHRSLDGKAPAPAIRQHSGFVLRELTEIIAAVEEHLALLKELRATGKVEYSYGAESDYATFVTTDKKIVKKYGFMKEDD